MTIHKPRTIIVAPYSSQWPQDFASLKADIWPAVASHALDIQHVGSTAVPGLCAKPIIDIDIVVADQTELEKMISALESLGYKHLGDLGIKGREAFQAANPAIAHHLYACIEGSEALDNHLALRDHLRTHPADRAAYGELKKALAKKFPHDIDSYIQGKTAFIEGILSRYKP